MSIQQSVRGTQDLIGPKAQRFRDIEALAWKKAQNFGFQQMATPIFEFTEVFKRSLGDTTDIITKEMYTFNDRSDESLTLRPEGTAGVVRAFLSNGMTHELPLKFFYSGPMFRYERPQKGRMRQFHQLGVEVLGHANPLVDVETISLAKLFLADLGLEKNTQLELNTLGDPESRQRYRQALTEYFSQHRAALSSDSQARLETNPLRILDSKSEQDQKLVADAPKLDDHLSDESKEFIDQVKGGLDQLGISFVWNDRLVRGLDYYCHTVFEFTTTDLGAQNAVLAGGRYDGLVELMGGKSTPGVGWAAGIERLEMLAAEDHFAPSPRPVAVLPMSASAQQKAAEITFQLRQAGLSAEQTFSGQNLGKLMKKANKWQATAAVILGDNELEAKKATVKALDTGEQFEVALGDLASYLAQNFAASLAK